MITKIDLQLLADAIAEKVEGKYSVLMFRLLEDQKKKKGAKLALQTDHSLSSSTNTTVTITKDGPIVAVGSPEKEYNFSFFFSRGDTLAAELKKAHDQNLVVELWNPIIDPASVEGKHHGSYCRGYITDYTESAPAEDYVKIDMTFKVDLIPQEGEITIDAKQASAIQYAFRDVDVVAE